MARTANIFSIAFLLLFLSDHGLSFTIHSESAKPLAGFKSMQSNIQSIHTQRLNQCTRISFPSCTLAATPAATEVVERERRVLDAKQLDFVLGYLNKHHEDLLVKLAETFSELGVKKKKANSWSGGSYEILSAKITGIDTKSLTLEVEINQRRGGAMAETVEVDLGE